MKRLLVLATILILAQPLWAHEFWLQPEQFQPPAGTAVPVHIRVGMDLKGKPWKGDLSNIIELALFHGSDRVSLIEAGYPESPEFSVKVDETGQYLVGFTNKSSFIELDAEDFEKYVLSEGLESVVEQRKTLGESDQAGRELYRRCAKALLQADGTKKGEAYSQKFGFPLELTPLTDPYAEDTALQSFELSYLDKPLEGAQIVVWHEEEGRVNRRALRTDEKGTITFPLTRQGNWMVSVVHMVRAEESKKADWQSYWGSFTFGY